MTMKAWVYERYGSPDVLGFEEVETPTPAGDEVAVRIQACGLNAADWHVMRADPSLVRLSFGLRRHRCHGGHPRRDSALRGGPPG
jgi:NADPH:quinone reductase-like Zn-dependent oxidoreductase